MGLIFLHNSTFIQVAYGWCYLHKARLKWISLPFDTVTHHRRPGAQWSHEMIVKISLAIFFFSVSRSLLRRRDTTCDTIHNFDDMFPFVQCKKKRNNHKIYTRKKSVERVMAMNVLNVHIYYFGSKRSNPIFARLTSSGRVFSCSFVSSKKYCV